MLRRAARKDENSDVINDVLRDLGFIVVNTARVGNGFGDCVIARRNRTWVVEIKKSRNKGPKIGWKLTPAEKKFHATWPDDVPIFDSVESVLTWEKTL